MSKFVLWLIVVLSIGVAVLGLVTFIHSGQLGMLSRTPADDLRTLCYLFGGIVEIAAGCAGVIYGVDAFHSWEERQWAKRMSDVERHQLHEEDFRQRYLRHGVEQPLRW